MKELMTQISQIKNLKYVFFDIFDTILLREVHPEYTKMIWAKRMSVQYANKLTAYEIYNLRNKIEIQLCERNEIEGKDREFIYEQLICQLYSIFKTEQLFSTHFEYTAFYRLCLDIETDIELAVQYVDTQWIETVKKIKSSTSLKVICVSDFYLPAQTITEFFEFHGISSYIDDLIVSSEYLITKRTGKLFQMILDANHIDPSTVLMVGDNELSDYQVPLGKKMHAYLVNRTSERNFYNKFLNENQFNNSDDKKNKLIQIATEGRKKTPFHNLIFSLFFFIKKLHEDLINNGIQNVFFLSREGEYLKKLFDIYQQHEGFRKVQKINTHYLKVSRKSTFLPSLGDLKSEQFNILFRQYRSISAYEFMASLNFEDSFIKRITEELNINLSKKEQDFPTSPTYYKLVESEMFKTYYETHRIEQKEMFKLYVEEFNANVRNEGLHIIDVGWKGTIQDNLWNIFDGEISISGYYVGLVSQGNMRVGNDKKGLVFSSVFKETEYFGVFNENRAIFEIMLGASHGSAERYIEIDNKHIDVLTNKNDKEREIFKQIVLPAQTDMLKTFEKLCELFCLRSSDLNSSCKHFASIHADLMFSPSRDELLFFDKLYHYENFGVFEFTEFHVQKQRVSFVELLNNTTKLLKNPHGFFSNSFWGPITLKDRGLAFLIPLYSWYKRRKYFNDPLKLEKNNSSHDKIEFIQNLENMIKDRDNVIMSMTRMIDDRDDAIKSMTGMIDERDALIKNLYLKIEEDIQIRENK